MVGDRRRSIGQPLRGGERQLGGRHHQARASRARSRQLASHGPRRPNREQHLAHAPPHAQRRGLELGIAPVSREPVRDRYDAIVDLFPHEQANNFAYAIVKLTYEVSNGQAVLTQAKPLEHDLRDPELDPKMPVGSDFWPGKDATDVLVRGSAYARAPVQETWVGVQVGKAVKHIKVIGQRYVEWRGAVPGFSAPEPFEEMAITNANAYGGCDLR